MEVAVCQLKRPPTSDPDKTSSSSYIVDIHILSICVVSWGRSIGRKKWVFQQKLLSSRRWIIKVDDVLSSITIISDDYNNSTTKETRTNKSGSFLWMINWLSQSCFPLSTLQASLSLQCFHLISDSLTMCHSLNAFFLSLFCTQQNQQLLFYSYIYLSTIFPWQYLSAC